MWMSYEDPNNIKSKPRQVHLIDIVVLNYNATDN